VAAASWTLAVDGLVESPLRLERGALACLARTQETRGFHWSRAGASTSWAGKECASSDLLAQAKPQAGARFVTFSRLRRHYTDSLTLAEATAPRRCLPNALDGAPLPAAHGGPLRLVIPSQLGYKSVKWVVRLELTATRAQGYWERNGDYPAEAPVA